MTSIPPRHSGPRLFITGIPTAGKSHLAKRLAEATKGTAVYFDRFRAPLFAEPEYRPWLNFYVDQDEAAYLKDVSPDKKWKNLVAQSEGLWPAFLKAIDQHTTETKAVIFECVNLLPHLTHRDLDFPGMVLIGTSREQTLERIRQKARWSDDPHLQELEADMFFNVERPRYRAEAERYDYPVFEDPNEAFAWAIHHLQNS